MDREFLIKGYIVDGDKIINEQTGEEIPDMPVFVLHLSIRPLNVLNRETETIRKLPHNELCISDLLLQNPWEFRRLRNLGEKSAEEIISELKQYLENPEFVITYSGWKVSDDESVLTKKPTVTTEATKDSPIGEYAIVVSGGEARNYELNYQNGVLTIIESTGIAEISVISPADVYTLQGHKVRTKVTTLEGLPKGVYVINGKKVVVK